RYRAALSFCGARTFLPDRRRGHLASLWARLSAAGDGHDAGVDAGGVEDGELDAGGPGRARSTDFSHGCATPALHQNPVLQLVLAWHRRPSFLNRRSRVTWWFSSSHSMSRRNCSGTASSSAWRRDFFDPAGASARARAAWASAVARSIDSH